MLSCSATCDALLIDSVILTVTLRFTCIEKTNSLPLKKPENNMNMIVDKIFVSEVGLITKQ